MLLSFISIASHRQKSFEYHTALRPLNIQVLLVQLYIYPQSHLNLHSLTDPVTLYIHHVLGVRELLFQYCVILLTVFRLAFKAGNQVQSAIRVLLQDQNVTRLDQSHHWKHQFKNLISHDKLSSQTDIQSFQTCMVLSVVIVPSVIVSCNIYKSLFASKLIH